MRKTAAGPGGVRLAGSVQDIDRAEAYRLIESGSAEQLDEDTEIEHARLVPSETAVGRKQRRR